MENQNNVATTLPTRKITLNNGLETNTEFCVRRILGTIGEYSSVTLNKDAFLLIIQKGKVLPLMKYTTAGSADGKGARIFNFDGIQVITNYDEKKERILEGRDKPWLGGTNIYIKNSDIEKYKLHIPLTEENSAKVSINFGMFNIINAIPVK